MSWDLVADIGGTNMRVAEVRGGTVQARTDFRMQPDREVSDVLGDIATRVGQPPRKVVAAAAGPVVDRAITLTNGGWVVGEDSLALATGALHVRVINDFEAAAWSLAALAPGDVQPIGQSAPFQHGTRIAIGPGTGLGVGALIQQHGQWTPLAGEGGHVAIAPCVAEEEPVFDRLCAANPDFVMGETRMLEAEAILSGSGLPRLYAACGGTDPLDGAAILARARSGERAAGLCRRIFVRQLGALAGDLAVTFKATGGVFLLGGVAQANPDLFGKTFWEAFAAGGRASFSDLRARCGVYLVKHEDFGLRGCIAAADHLD